MARESDKRKRLVAAAAEEIYRHGYAGVTLARVAERAEVPLGNVYYYFKTKESLAEAVLDARIGEIEELIRAAAEEASPARRLRAFVRRMVEAAESVSMLGCPYGSLVLELDKKEGVLSLKARRLFELQLDWFTRQFRELGLGRQSAFRARELLAGLQGASLISEAFGDRRFLEERSRGFGRWLKSLDPAPAAAAGT